MRKTENIINRTGINKTECKKTGHSKENKIPGVKCTPKIELYLSNFKGALHWWNGSLFFLIIILGITLGIFAGCKNIFVPEPPATPEAAGPGGGITVSLRLFTGSARSVMPGMKDLIWEITASQGDITISVAEGEYPKFSLSLPVSGTWTFTVRGINSDNDEIFTGSAEQNIESGSTTSISIPLSPGSGMEEGTGTIDLTMTVPTDVNKVMYKLDSDSDFDELTPFNDSCSLNKTGVSAGIRTLFLYFLDGNGTTVYMCTETVNVWNGVTSNLWIKTNDEEYIVNGEFVITEDMVNKFVKTMGSVVFVNSNVDANTPATGSIYAPVNSVSTAVDILRKANPGGKCNGTIMVSGETTIEDEIEVKNSESLTIKGMEADASITNDAGRVFKITGGSLTLEENITLTGTVTNDNGGAVYVNGGTFTMKAGSKITGSSAIYGGGVYVDSKGTFTMGGGTISKNSASSIDATGTGASGGGVCISDGTFTMNGGAVISGNMAIESGGGVFFSGSGKFTMEGGTIGGSDVGSPNSAENGGGVYIYNGTFTMSDNAVINGNKASGISSSGGGVYIHNGAFTMSDSAVISGNSATSSGGGVYVYETGVFTMEGGTIGEIGGAISGNSSGSGGGVCVYKGTFTMNGGIITGNTTDGNGAGVYLDGANAKVTLNNTSSISENVAAGEGGGVYVGDGNFTVNGSPKIKANGFDDNSNVYLANGKTITIGAEGLTGGTIGVTAENVTSGSEVPITDEDVTGADTIFTSDNTAYSIVEYNGAVYLSDAETVYVAGAGSTETLGLFKDAIVAVNNSTYGGTITLLKNIDRTNAVFGNNNDTPITFTGGTEAKPIILDLNGKTINRGLDAAIDDGSVIKIISGATLTIKDSSATNSDGTGGTGTITGGNTSMTGGGIYLATSGAAMTLEGGTISGNTAVFNGGGVGVSVGTFTMTGGIISGNTAGGNGGGVYVHGNDSNFTMTGGTIGGTEPNTADLGGGVYVGSSDGFTLGSSIAEISPVISGNTKTGNSTNNVYLDGIILLIDGELKKSVDSGNIGISMATPGGEFTYGWSDSTVPTFFFSDDTKRTVALSGSELSLNLVRVEGGICTLNSKQVTLSDFWISPYEVTQEEFESIMKENSNSITSNPSYFQGEERPPADGEEPERRPVEQVRWYEAIVYCNLLSMKEGLPPCYTIKGSTDPAYWGTSPTSDSEVDYDDWKSVICDFKANGYRLPTEAEWEYAARGGQTGQANNTWNYTYSGSDTIGNVAWYMENSDNKTHEVGKKNANALGLYDMSGNVSEWCWDWRSDSYPSNTENPAGPESGEKRVSRGGRINTDDSAGCGVGDQNSAEPYEKLFCFGFRVVRSIR